MHRSGRVCVALVAWSFGAASLPSSAQAPPLSGIEFSTDAAAVLGGVPVGPSDVASDDLAGTVAITGIGLPVPAFDVDAFDRLPDGDTLYSLATPFAMVSGAVIRVSGGVETSVFSGVFLGTESNVDAVAQTWADCPDLLVSFADAGVLFNDVAFEDEDLIGMGSQGPYLAFDGSAAGIPDALDLDAVDVASTGELWLSFDAAGAVPGDGGPVAFEDEDILAYDPDTGFFELAYDGSAEFAAWGPVNLDAFSNPDSDGDGLADVGADNCPGAANPAQEDGEDDGAGDVCDNCPVFANAGQADSDCDGRGNACECGDQNGDGVDTVSDIVAINLRQYAPPPLPPLCGPGVDDPCSMCDANGDDECDVRDMTALNNELFSVGSTSTCARQPFAGP
jgi:hypothetical protein